MFRAYFTNKWVLGGFCFVIVFGIACYFWYQHELAPYKQQAAETEEMLRQEAPKKSERVVNAQAIDAAPTDTASAESNTLTTEKPSTMTPPVTEKLEPTRAPQQTETPLENEASAEVLVSPYGFGPYPEVPEDFPTKHLVSWPEDSPTMELLNRVLIKLWTEGEKNFRGGVIESGRVFPWYHNTVYVSFSKTRTADGKWVRYARGKMSGPGVNYTGADLLNPPPPLRVLDLEDPSVGINPYEYLDLEKEKGNE